MSKRFSDEYIKEITERAPLLDVISARVILQRKGGRYWGLCPFHHEETPSFCVDPKKDVWFCFGCEKGGGLFTFVMEAEKIGFADAVEFIANWGERNGSTQNS